MCGSSTGAPFRMRSLGGILDGRVDHREVSHREDGADDRDDDEQPAEQNGRRRKFIADALDRVKAAAA